MARVYAVASAKGGVGKTTTTANLGVTLAAAGHRVAVVDADVGMPNLGRTLGLSIESDAPTVHDVLAGEADPTESVVEGPHGLGVVPGSTSLDAYASADPRELRGVLDALADDGYDFVLVDTGAGLSHDTVLPLGLADAVLLVSTPSPDALGDTERTRQLTERVGAPVAGLVLTRADAARTDPDAVADELGLALLGVVPEDPAVDEATTDGEPVVTRDVDAPAAAAYRTLAGAIVAEALDEPFDENSVVAAMREAAGAAPGFDRPRSGGATDADGSDEPDGTVGSAAEAVDAGSDDPDGPTAEGVDGIDVAAALADDADDLNAALDLDDGTGGRGESDDCDDPDDTEAEDGGPASDDTGTDAEADADVGGDADVSGDADVDGDAEAGVDTAARVESGAGLASTLADVESGASDESGARDESGQTNDENEDSTGDDAPDAPDALDADGTEAVSVADAVAEAEPDSEGEVAFETTDDTAASDGTDVTIQPDDAPDIPDAEAEAVSGTDRTAEGKESPAAGSEGSTGEAEDAPDDGEGSDGTDTDDEKGLFGRFFG